MTVDDLFDEDLTQDTQDDEQIAAEDFGSGQTSTDESFASRPNEGYVSSLDDDVRKRLLEAYDQHNAKPLYSSMVDAFYRPRVKSDEDLKKQSGLQTAFGALADAVSSGIEGAAGGAPVRQRNVFASQLANHANEVLRAKNDALKDQYARAKMSAKAQDISMGERAFAESQNAIQRYLASKQRAAELDQRNRYNQARLAQDQFNKDRSFGLDQEKLRLKADHDEAMLRETQRRNSIYGSHVSKMSSKNDGQDFWLENEDGEGQMVKVPKSGYSQVRSALMEEGYKALRAQLRADGTKEFYIPEMLKAYDKQAVLNIGLNTENGRKIVMNYGGVQPVKSLGIQTQKSVDSPIEREIKRIVDTYPNASEEALVRLAHEVGVPNVVDVRGLIKKHKQ